MLAENIFNEQDSEKKKVFFLACFSNEQRLWWILIGSLLWSSNVQLNTQLQENIFWYLNAPYKVSSTYIIILIIDYRMM